MDILKIIFGWIESVDAGIITKIIFVSNTQMKVKYVFGETTEVILFDFQHSKIDINYLINNSRYIISLHGAEGPTDAPGTRRYTLGLPVNFNEQKRLENDLFILSELTFPYYAFVGEGETETDETATETIVFPPPDTPEQFFERIWARLLNLTRRIRILRHEEPHQNALSEDICREVPADHDEVLRYDIACNLIKRPVGWLALQLENYQTRYNRHLEAVVKANEAGRTPPTFNVGTDQTKIEAMLEKLEANLTEECLEEHFDMHDHAEWDKIQNKQRKITLCNEDSTPGEVLVDVNSFFTDGRGNIAEEHAKRTYHEISTKYWVMAKRTPHRNLITQRTVEIA